MKPLFAALPGLLLFLVLLLLLLLGPDPSRAAPKDTAGTHRVPELPQQDPRDDPALLNPLHPREGSLRVLQDYLKSVGQADEKDSSPPMTRERTLLLLFALHDHDKSGRLDGLEFMWLLSDLATQQSKRRPPLEAVEQMVDHILETQDRNRDGLLEPPELVLAPRQAQHPESPASPGKGEGEGEEEVAVGQGTILWAEAPRPPEQFGHQAQGVREAPSPNPLPEQPQGASSQEAERQGDVMPPNPQD